MQVCLIELGLQPKTKCKPHPTPQKKKKKENRTGSTHSSSTRISCFFGGHFHPLLLPRAFSLFHSHPFAGLNMKLGSIRNLRSNFSSHICEHARMHA